MYLTNDIVTLEDPFMDQIQEYTYLYWPDHVARS